MVGIYFKENDKNRYKFFIASIRIQAGEDPRDIVILSWVQWICATSTINDLTSQDKQTITRFCCKYGYAQEIKS